MTPPKPPSDLHAPGRPVPGPGGDPAPDVLADLPPMPRTRPVRKAAPDAQPADKSAQADTGLSAVTKKELFARVKARAGKVKGSDVRQVMDAVLEELGTALVAGEALKVPALGTLKVQRRKSRPNADVVVCKLSRKKRGQRAKDPLAKPAEDS